MIHTQNKDKRNENKMLLIVVIITMTLMQHMVSMFPNIISLNIWIKKYYFKIRSKYTQVIENKNFIRLNTEWFLHFKSIDIKLKLIYICFIFVIAAFVSIRHVCIFIVQLKYINIEERSIISLLLKNCWLLYLYAVGFTRRH